MGYDYPEDIKRIQLAAFVYLNQFWPEEKAYRAWLDYSEMSSASWLLLPASLESVAQAVSSYCEDCYNA
jgi:hypothetical protein